MADGGPLAARRHDAYRRHIACASPSSPLPTCSQWCPQDKFMMQENSLPWHTDWSSSAELRFPLVADQFHRDAHPLIRQYVCSQIGGGDLTLGSLLRFRGGIGNDHCEICDHSTCRGSLIIAIAASRQENLDSLRESEIRGHSFGRRVLH